MLLFAPEDALLRTRDTVDVQPTPAQANHFLLATYHHALGMERSLNHIEHYAHLVPVHDTQRPHDLAGPHHKLTWHVFRGLALFPEIHRSNLPPVIRRVIDTSLAAHRQQDHHSTLRTHPVGALDALHSVLENRGYQGGNIPLDRLEPWIEHQLYHDMRPAARAVLPILQDIGYINLNAYQSIAETPNPGVPEPIFRAITTRTKRFRDALEAQGYAMHV